MSLCVCMCVYLNTQRGRERESRPMCEGIGSPKPTEPRVFRYAQRVKGVYYNILSKL